MKRRFVLVCLFTVFLDCRSTKLLRLFFRNVPAMFVLIVVDYSQTAFEAIFVNACFICKNLAIALFWNGFSISLLE